MTGLIYGLNIFQIGLLCVFPGIFMTIYVYLRYLNNPAKSIKYHFADLILTPVRYFRLWKYKQGEISLENAIKYAQKKTKLHDFGEGSTMFEYYSKVWNLTEQKCLIHSNLGYLSAQVELNMTFVRKLRTVQWFKDVPEYAQTPVRSPIFVTGLPRTGTTFLHRLLAVDTQFRAPLLWELLACTPNINKPRTKETEAEYEEDLLKRKNFVKKLVQFRKSVGDDTLAHIHEFDYDLPEECLIALTDEMPLQLSLLYGVYVSGETFLELDATKAYQWYRQQLQMISYQCGEIKNPRKYMLKCPAHLSAIKPIATAFPDAKIIWTHRHPVSAVTSLCSLISSVHKVFYTNTRSANNQMSISDLVGSACKKMSSNLLCRAPQDIKEAGLDHTDVIYDDLIKDPKSVVKQIYKNFKWEYTKEYDSALDSFLAQDKLSRDKVKKERQISGAALHTYRPEDYSLTKEELSSGEFANYIRKFNLPVPK